MEYIYGALLLHKLGKEISEHNVKTLISASGTQADESKVKSLIASLKGVDIEKELKSASFAVAGAGSADGAHPAKEEKKEETAKEEKKEAAAEGLSALFG